MTREREVEHHLMVQSDSIGRIAVRTGERDSVIFIHGDAVNACLPAAVAQERRPGTRRETP